MYLQITIERAKKVTVDNDRAYPLDLQIQIYNGWANFETTCSTTSSWCDTHSQTSNTTCCKRSGNFCTIVTGWPLVKLTPYIGAVVLYLVLHNLAGEPHVSFEENPLPGNKRVVPYERRISWYLDQKLYQSYEFRWPRNYYNFFAKLVQTITIDSFVQKNSQELRKKSEKNLKEDVVTRLRDWRPFFGILSVRVFETTSGSPVSRYEQNER